MVKQNFPVPSKNIESNENKPKVYFADSCDICKKEGVFLLDNKCQECLHPSSTGDTQNYLFNTNASEYQLKEKEVSCGSQSNTADLALVAYTKKLLEDSKTKSCPICFNLHRRNLYCTSCEFKINTGAIPNPETNKNREVTTIENLFR